MKDTRWYEFYQNNSGGDEILTLGQPIWVEADSADQANERALEFGVYFDGVDSGEDCDCCGNRWTRAREEWSQKETPSGGALLPLGPKVILPGASE